MAPQKNVQCSRWTRIGIGLVLIAFTINMGTIYIFHFRRKNVTDTALPGSLKTVIHPVATQQAINDGGRDSRASIPPYGDVPYLDSPLTPKTASVEKAKPGPAAALVEASLNVAHVKPAESVDSPAGTGEFNAKPELPPAASSIEKGAARAKQGGERAGDEGGGGKVNAVVRNQASAASSSSSWPNPSVVAVLYNRVDKCGSSSFVEMIRRSSGGNSVKEIETREFVTFRTDKAMKTPAQTQSKVEEHLRGALHQSKKFVFHGHFYLMDVNVFKPQHGPSDILFINQIRDPLKRIISRWNYLAYGPRPDPKTKVEVTQLRKSLGAPTLVEFATHPDRAQLMYKLDMFPMRFYFCTAAERDQCSVERAIANLDKYAVVAVLEKLQESLAVMSYRIPGFFAGAADVFPTKKVRENENCKLCEKPDNATKAALAEMYADDQRLFAACLAKLDMDFASLPDHVRQAAQARSKAKAEAGAGLGTQIPQAGAVGRVEAVQEPPKRRSVELQGVQGVLYNRVDKCGSTSFVQMMRTESKLRHFFEHETKQYISYTGGMEASSKSAAVATKKVQDELDYQLKKNSEFFFHGHFHLLIQPEAVQSKVAYVNLVRDPVKRIISRWNYLAYGPRPNPKSKEQAIQLRKSLGVPSLHALARHPDRAQLLLKVDMFPMRSYFCSNQERESCSAETAIANLKHYAVVAVLEQMDDSLALLAARLPAFFSEAREEFPQKKLREIAVDGLYRLCPETKCLERPVSPRFEQGAQFLVCLAVGECERCEVPDEKTLALLRELYAHDLAFYQACVQKLQADLETFAIKRGSGVSEGGKGGKAL